ncbi:MAG: DUF1887 family CARF protein [Sulfurimonas sp.]|jgi:hypothetical protein|nr:DUF1887 family CARF protein [Sulfurimonas sp.]
MTLVSIVGDFHSSILPLFYEYKDEMTQHILLYDSFSRDVRLAQQVSSGIEEFCQKYKCTFKTREYILHDDTLESLAQCAKTLLSYVEDPKDLYINITDGFASVTTVLNHILFKEKVNFFSYDMFNNAYTLINYNTFDKKPLQKKMSIQDHFMLKGFGVETSDIKKFAQEHEKLITLLIEKYHRPYNQFLGVDPKSAKNIAELPKQHYLIRDIFMQYGFGAYTVKDPHLTGNIFESYIYNLIKDLDYDDIEVGFKVYEKYKNSRISNEFDILIMKDNHLHMIECKYLNRVKLEELIYKYTALSNILDDDGKILLVTKKPSVYSKEVDRHEHKGLVYKRGILNNIKVLGDVKSDPKHFVAKVKQEFGI